MKCKCSDQIVNIAFDKTSSNTGHQSAVCIAIQDKLERALLWSGYRHHIGGEVVISHVFNDFKIENSKSPDAALFSKLRSNWNLLPQTSEQAAAFQPADYSLVTQVLLALMRDETQACAARIREFVRYDYWEFRDQSVVFLGADGSKMNFLRPGALHNARCYTAKTICMW